MNTLNDLAAAARKVAGYAMCDRTCALPAKPCSCGNRAALDALSRALDAVEKSALLAQEAKRDAPPAPRAVEWHDNTGPGMRWVATGEPIPSRYAKVGLAHIHLAKGFRDSDGWGWTIDFEPRESLWGEAATEAEAKAACLRALDGGEG